METANIEETEEPATIKDAIVIGFGTILVIASAGAIARIGWDAAGEGIDILKKKRAAKKAAIPEN